MTRSLIALAACLLALLPSIVLADKNSAVVTALTNADLYISPHVVNSGHVHTGDRHRLLSAIREVGSKGVPVKVALLGHYPNPKGQWSPFDAADHLRNFIAFSGVLVLVSPKGMGVSSDYLSSETVHQIVARSQGLCAGSYASCAIAAMRASVPGVKAEQSRANRNVAVFWVVAVVLFGILVAVLVWTARRRQEQPQDRTGGSGTPDPAPSGTSG